MGELTNLVGDLSDWPAATSDRRPRSPSASIGWSRTRSPWPLPTAAPATSGSPWPPSPAGTRPAGPDRPGRREPARQRPQVEPRRRSGRGPVRRRRRDRPRSRPGHLVGGSAARLRPLLPGRRRPRPARFRARAGHRRPGRRRRRRHRHRRPGSRRRRVPPDDPPRGEQPGPPGCPPATRPASTSTSPTSDLPDFLSGVAVVLRPRPQHGHRQPALARRHATYGHDRAISRARRTARWVSWPAGRVGRPSATGAVDQLDPVAERVVDVAAADARQLLVRPDRQARRAEASTRSSRSSTTIAGWALRAGRKPSSTPRWIVTEPFENQQPPRAASGCGFGWRARPSRPA